MDSQKVSIWLTKSVSPYTRKEQVLWAIWWAVEALFFRPSFHRMHGWRVFLLRLFGAKIGKNVSIHQRVRVFFPWKLVIGNESGIGFDTLIYNLDRVTIGDYVSIAQRVHVNTGSHDFTDPELALETKPVTIRSGVFIGTDTYIGPGVVLDSMSVIGARSVVTKSMPASMICFGHPCRPIRPRLRKKA